MALKLADNAIAVLIVVRFLRVVLGENLVPEPPLQAEESASREGNG